MYFTLVFIMSIILVMSLFPLLKNMFIIKIYKKVSPEPVLFFSILLFGLLLLSIYMKISYLLYGFDSSSEAAHIMKTLSTKHFEYTQSAFSNVLSLVVTIPILLEVSGMSIIIFYKGLYPLLLSLYIIFFYTMVKDLFNKQKEYTILMIILFISSYVFFYGLLSTIKYGITYVLVLTTIFFISKYKNVVFKDYIVLIILIISIILSYYSNGILLLFFLGMGYILFSFRLVVLDREHAKLLGYILITGLIFAFMYWFYYAQATRQHLIDALKYLILNTEERVETKTSFVYTNIRTNDILPVIGTYLKIGTLVIIYAFAILGFIMYSKSNSNKEKLTSLNLAQIGLVTLFIALGIFGPILGLYFVSFYYSWSIPLLIIVLIRQIKKPNEPSKNILVKTFKKFFILFLYMLILVNFLNSLQITNYTFHMKGDEPIEKIIFNKPIPLSITYSEYFSIIDIIKLASPYLSVIPDIYNRANINQVLALTHDHSEKIVVVGHLQYPIKSKNNACLYLGTINLVYKTFYLPKGGYGTPVSLDEIYDFKKMNIVFNSKFVVLSC